MLRPSSFATSTPAWECGETGTWYVDDGAGAAAYIESNFWGRIPLD